MTPRASARTRQAIRQGGRLAPAIEHDSAVTPALLRWWVDNVGQDIGVDGQSRARHGPRRPRDHDHRDGGAAQLVATLDEEGDRSRRVAGIASGAFGGPCDPLVRPHVFSAAVATARLTHGVEEVALSEHTLSSLQAARRRPAPRPARLEREAA